VHLKKFLAGPSHGLDHNAHRSHMLRLAILSSGLSKISSLAQLGISIPLVFHTLGTHEYALYLLLTAALATIAFMQMGAGPGLTSAIAKAHAEGNHNEQAGAFASALLFVLGTTLLGGGIISTVVRMVPPTRLFGTNFAFDQPEIIHTTNVCILVMVATTVLSVVDSALAGYLEQVASNLGNLVGNLVSAGLLIVVCYHRHATIVQVILVMYGVTGLSRIANLLILVSRRPYLLTGFAHMNHRSMRKLVSVGTAFSLIQVSCMFEQSGGTYVMAHLSTVESTDIFGLVYKGVSLAASVVGIFTQPLWPTIADALARHDFNWIQQTARKTRQSLMTIAGTLTAGLTAASVLGIEHVWHVKIGTNRALIIVLAIYLFTNIWTHYHYILLEGLDRVWAVAGLVLLENSMMLAFGTIFVPRWGAIGMAGAYLVASIVVPAWLLPCILGGRLTELKEACIWLKIPDTHRKARRL